MKLLAWTYPFATCWLRPVWTARRTDRVSMFGARAAHMLASLAVVLLIVLFASWSQCVGYESRGVIDRTLMILGYFFKEWAAEPLLMSLVVGGVAGAIELGFVVAAVLGMAWGARDEPMWQSFKVAVRRTWLHTPHLIVVAFLVGGWSVALELSCYDWGVGHEEANPHPEYVAYRRGAASDSPENRAYGDYLQAARQWSEAYEKVQPWWHTHELLLHMVAYLLAIPWFIWAWLRAVGAVRDVKPINRDPTCEACGYSLVGASMEGRCPECGRPAVESLSPSGRVGSPWQRRATIGLARAWWQTTVGVVFHSAEFGMRLRSASPGTDHRTFLAGHTVVAILIGPACVLAMYVARGWFRHGSQDIEVLTVGMPVAAIGSIAAWVVLICGSAGIAGGWFRFRSRRNLLSVSMQMAAYAAPFALLAMATAGSLLVVSVVMDWTDSFEFLRVSTGITEDVWCTLLWCVPTGVAVLWLARLVIRGTGSARWANS